jgi:amphi-Trp domain-containing protein
MGDQDKTLFESESEYTREQLAELLEKLASELREGSVSVDGKSEPVPEQLHLSLERKNSPKPDGLKHELELELWWMEST